MPATTINSPSGMNESEAPPLSHSFVSVTQIKDHLALLHAFAELKTQVGEMVNSGLPHLPSDHERRWAWFVGLSVERFERWCKALQLSHSDKGLATLLPPVDVLMVWHAYLLNPGCYAQDGARISALKGLQCAGSMLTASLGGELGILLASEPSKQRVENWVQTTATPFDPFEAATQMLSREIACPKCCFVVSAPYMTEGGTGYLQHGFAIPCASDTCTFKITKDTLALRKLADDLARQDMGHPAAFLAGTFVLDRERGRAVQAATRSSSVQSKADPSISDADFLMERADYQVGRLRAAVALEMEGQRETLISQVMSAYVDDKIFSVELVSAVLRQGSFVSKMYNLQWTQPGFFDRAQYEVILQHAVARYHAFLDLMASSPAAFFVPTLDIDLAWHTHQLMANQYSKDTVAHVGRFIDHDDKVDESRLASSFDSTCRAWKKRYGMQYACCECAVPGARSSHRNVVSQLDTALLAPVPMHYKSAITADADVGVAACGSGCGGGCGGGGCGGGCGGGGI